MPDWWPELCLFVFLSHMPFFAWRYRRTGELRFAATTVTFALLSVTYALRVFAPGLELAGTALWRWVRWPAWLAAALSLGLLGRHALGRLRRAPPPQEVPQAVEALYAAAHETAAEASCAAQVAVARDGVLLASRAFGHAPFGGGEARAGERSLFALFSVTKAIVASASWILLQEERLELGERVAEIVPGFAENGKQDVSVEQLLTHTAGFPTAWMDPRAWPDPERRRAAFASWKLEWEPGTRFTYHGTSSLWVLADVIGVRAGMDYRDFVRARILEPLGLRDLFLGLPDAEQGRVAEVVAVGEPMSREQRAVSPVDAPTLDDAMVAGANRPELRAIGSPGGGALGSAADVARFYQGILADLGDRSGEAGRGPGIWRPEVVASAITPRNPDFVDPMTGRPALRGLGVVVAGEEGRIWRGFPEACSPRSFGHMGAGGQMAWADPASGLSFAWVTNGAQRNPVRQGATGLRISSLAAACA